MSGLLCIPRRQFIRGGIAAGALFGGHAWALPRAPHMRIGLMTDTHVGSRIASCSRVRQALRLFKEHGCDIVINNGDVADRHDPQSYLNYRQVSDEVFGESAPREIFAYAWHDAYGYLGHGSDRAIEDGHLAFTEMRKLLRAENGPVDRILHRGYVFLVMSEYTGYKGYLTWEEYESRIARACAENPGRPVFLVDHVPPSGTVYNSYNWGCGPARRILDKYPQVVDLTGHVHGSLRNDLFVWQGNFTVINSGCLQHWDGLQAANPDMERKEEFGVITIDVFDDLLDVRRWDVRDGGEIGAESPWRIPLPFVAAMAPYARERRVPAEPLPGFAKGSSVAAEQVGTPFAGFRIRFPQVRDRTMLYRITLERRSGNAWRQVAWLEMFSDYWKHPSEREEFAELVLKEGLFDGDCEYRISVAPLNQYGAVGECIRTCVKVPRIDRGCEMVFESKDPMRELRFAAGGSGANPETPRFVQADKEGFLCPPGNYLLLPEGLFSGPRGTRYRVILDARTIQPTEGRTAAFRIKKYQIGMGSSLGLGTPLGDSGDERYVIDFVKDGKFDRDSLDVFVGGSVRARVCFKYIRIEKYEKKSGK